MIKDQRFITSIRDFQQMAPAELELFCCRLMPDFHFRFITFENNDYRTGNLTWCLYNQAPDSVFFSVETPTEIEPALVKLLELNPGVEWYWANLHYADQDDRGYTCVSIELRLAVIPMRVSAGGQLIHK